MLQAVLKISSSRALTIEEGTILSALDRAIEVAIAIVIAKAPIARSGIFCQRGGGCMSTDWHS